MVENERITSKIVLSKPVSVLGVVGGGTVFGLSVIGLGICCLILWNLDADSVAENPGLPLLTVITALLVLVTAISSMGACVAGIRRLLRPEIETTGPEPLRDYQGELVKGLTQGKLEFFGSLSSRLRLLFGENITSLPPIPHKIVKRNGNAVLGRAVKFPLLALVILAVYYYFPGEVFILPLLFLLGAGVAHLATDFLSARALVPTRPAVASADHGSRYYQGFGHPTHLFSRLPICASKLALPGFANRVYKWGETERSGVVKDTGEFSATVFIERQPELLTTESSVVGVWLLRVGWMWRVVAAGLLAFLPIYFDALLASSVLAGALILTVAIRLFFKGGAYVRQGVDLLDSLRFSSIGILVYFQGEISRANLKVGGTSVDSIGSENLATRSNFTAQFSAAELITETREITKSRYLLECRPCDASKKWIHDIQEEIEHLREERVRPAALDLSAAEFQEITAANRQILADQARIWSRPSETGTVRPEEADLQLLAADAQTTSGQPSPGQDSFKECPDCAESVREAAKKCRYCGFRFNSNKSRDTGEVG